jgi:FdrA protein
MMGPDCGTAIINGVPIAFANRVPRGDVGIVGASGTGMQEVSCLLARAAAAYRQAHRHRRARPLPRGRRAITTLMAIDRSTPIRRRGTSC